MVCFSSQGDDNKVTRRGDRKLYSKAVFIGQGHSIVAEGNSPFRYVRHFRVRSPFLAQYECVRNAALYSVIFGQQPGQLFCASAEYQKGIQQQKTTYFFCFSILHGTTQGFSRLLTRYRAVVPQCRKRRAVYSWFRCICWLSVGRGSYYCWHSAGGPPAAWAGTPLQCLYVYTQDHTHVHQRCSVLYEVLRFSLASGVPWLRLLLILFIIVQTEALSLTYSVDID